jgi:two-component system, OmpR family, copper resistance phosphate regulon response regulator CusR
VPDSAGITKPFHYPELLARIGAVLGRVSRSRDRQIIRHGELAVNLLSREATIGGIRLELSAKEYQLLTTLASERERVFTKPASGLPGGSVVCAPRRDGVPR